MIKVKLYLSSEALDEKHKTFFSFFFLALEASDYFIKSLRWLYTSELKLGINFSIIFPLFYSLSF